MIIHWEGTFTRDRIILEATSGNTGIGLAMVASAKKYRVKLTMPACVTVERRRTLEAFGAELILSPSHEGTDGAIKLAHRILSEEPERYVMPTQFDNQTNIRAHYDTTGREIIEQTEGRVTHFVAGIGTTYANEALFAARIHPARAAGRLSRQRYDRLAAAIRHTLQRALDAGGSTLRVNFACSSWFLKPCGS